MFYRDRRRLLFRPGSRKLIAIRLICLIAKPFQSLPEDFATILLLSMAGLDISLWLLSKGWLAVAA